MDCIVCSSLRVNLDMGKAFYSWSMQRDKEIAGTVVRSTTIPEELGRISYLLSDKTGTLTQNEMVFKKLHLGTVSFSTETFDEVSSHLTTAFTQQAQVESVGPSPTHKVRRSEVTRVLEAVKALALCHNVTPVYEEQEIEESHSPGSGSLESQTEADQHYWQQKQESCVYQASSPDEVALVRWTEEVSLPLVRRDLVNMHLRTPSGQILSFTILQIFPFTSETKRMGIILKYNTTSPKRTHRKTTLLPGYLHLSPPPPLSTFQLQSLVLVTETLLCLQEDQSGDITFYLKGADVVMSGIVQYNDWLEEECGNMAREGLRTLVVAKKSLTEEQYLEFEVLGFICMSDTLFSMFCLNTTGGERQEKGGGYSSGSSMEECGTLGNILVRRLAIAHARPSQQPL
uniref:Phospholipid-transporting ATPase IIB n=1 Tax=Timema shepardi TaxID=629360 RepID=A0A7R9AZS6_TIMSH|nr:unnamed protein product [Timema shepardi]